MYTPSFALGIEIRCMLLQSIRLFSVVMLLLYIDQNIIFQETLIFNPMNSPIKRQKIVRNFVFS